MNNTRLYLGPVALLPDLPSQIESIPAPKQGQTIELKNVNGMFVHLLNIDLCTLSCMHTYELVVGSNCSTSIRFFENVNGRLYPLDEREHRVHKKCLYRCKLNAKCVVPVTSVPCVLQMRVTPVRWSSNLSSHFTVVSDVIVPTIPEEQVRDIVQNLTSKSITLPLIDIVPVPTRSVHFPSIRYYLDTTSAITITREVSELYRYSPFSVKANEGSLLQLHYSLRMKTSAGKSALVTIKCIESIANNAYAPLKGLDNNEISASHIGQIATGAFVLPQGAVDVGLLITTPYGFRGDLHDDPDMDLIKFDVFQLFLA